MVFYFFIHPIMQKGDKLARTHGSTRTTNTTTVVTTKSTQGGTLVRSTSISYSEDNTLVSIQRMKCKQHLL